MGEQDVLRVGATRRPITPTIKGRKVFMAGYVRGRQAVDIHDELWVRAVAVQRGDATLILVVLDLLDMHRSDIEFIREQVVAQGIPTEGLVVACTRNHAGPDTLGLWGKGFLSQGLNTRYIQFLHREVVQVIRLAFESMEPARAYAACTQVVELSQEAEHELCVLQFRAENNRPLATVVNFPLAPRTLDESNLLISADLVHGLHLDLEQERDEVALYTCAGADERVPPPVQERSWKEAERIGRQLGEAARAALVGAAPMPVDLLAIGQKSFSIPAGDPVGRWVRRTSLVRRLWSERHLDSQVGLIELGAARIAVLPGLVTPELGFEIRKFAQ